MRMGTARLSYNRNVMRTLPLLVAAACLCARAAEPVHSAAEHPAAKHAAADTSVKREGSHGVDSVHAAKASNPGPAAASVKHTAPSADSAHAAHPAKTAPADSDAKNPAPHAADTVRAGKPSSVKRAPAKAHGHDADPPGKNAAKPKAEPHGESKEVPHAKPAQEEHAKAHEEKPAAHAEASDAKHESKDHAAGHAEKAEGNSAAAEGHGAAHAAPAEHEHGAEAREAPESGEEPSLAPRPDTAFARAMDWEKGQAEILEYAVKRTGIAGESKCRGRLVTERMFLRPDGTVSRKGGGKEETEILNADLSIAGEAGGIPFSIQTVSQLPRRGAFALLRQEQSLQRWPGTGYRSLDCRVKPPRLRVSSTGGESPRDTVLERWPVYTEEMLFTYLRALPFRAGYREEVWLQDWGAEGRIALKPRYASISVRSRAPGIRDTDTWYVTVDRDDGRRSEFWIASSGMHQVVVANLADGSEWILQGITRKAYWSW